MTCHRAHCRFVIVEHAELSAAGAIRDKPSIARPEIANVARPVVNRGFSRRLDGAPAARRAGRSRSRSKRAAHVAHIHSFEDSPGNVTFING